MIYYIILYYTILYHTISYLNIRSIGKKDPVASVKEFQLITREKNTIKKANKKLGGKLDEPNCRLACQAIAHGPVKIRPKGK